MTSPNPMALEAKALDAAREKTRLHSFSCLTRDEHDDLVSAAVRAYLAALPLPAAGEGLTPENSDWIEDAGPVARDGPASHAGEGLPPDRKHHYTVNLTEKEMDALEALAKEHDLPPWRVLLQGLRLYQLNAHPVDLGPMMPPSQSAAGEGLEPVDAAPADLGPMMNFEPTAEGQMSNAQIREWIDACNHGPARNALRELIALRHVHAGAPLYRAATPAARAAVLDARLGFERRIPITVCIIGILVLVYAGVAVALWSGWRP